MDPETHTAEINVQEWKSRVLDLCQKPGVSMVEVARLPDAKGSAHIRDGNRENVILWDGLQTNLVEAICELLASNQITVRSTSPLIYLIDGVSLRLPVAKPGKRKYKTPHWLPVALDLANNNDVAR